MASTWRSPRKTYPAGYDPVAAVCEDFDRNGWLDTVVVSYADSTLTHFRSNSEDGFEYGTAGTIGRGPAGIVSGDFNGDGFLDIAIATTSTAMCPIMYYFWITGTFVLRQDVAVGNGPEGIVAADFNQDGLLDFATANNRDDDVSVVYGQADGTFGGRRDYAVGEYPCGSRPGISTATSASTWPWPTIPATLSPYCTDLPKAASAIAWTYRSG